ncbi:hypothetical protein BYT27DRAFT_7340107 [Phlegmacium glaucopus]|nr:hypothetical protein BYT27DRAFT_7340107 [Phlegmacium glaucopus]
MDQPALPVVEFHSHKPRAPYQILGRAVKNEYLAIGIFSTVFGGAWLSTRGGAKAAPKPTTVQQAKESVPVKADSTEEEQFILNFIREAEKEDAGASAGH